MAEPWISLCMIARDEEALLPRCLDSASRWVDEIVLVDTGSSDGTVACAKARGARVIPHVWRQDFSAARNAALAEARGCFVLVLDADEWIESRGFPAILRRRLEVPAEAFTVKISDRLDAGGKRSYPLVRLFRNRPEHRYEGAFHEQITPSIARRLGRELIDPVDSGLTVGHDGYLLERRTTRAKADRNLRLLRRLVAEQPEDVSSRYFLIREQVPMRGGRAVPGSHLAEALEHCARLNEQRASLAPGLDADFTKLHAAALLAAGRAGQARELLARSPASSAAFELLRADAALATSEPRAVERALDDVRDAFDREGPGELPFSEPALTGPLARTRAAECLLHLGRTEEARRLASEAAALEGGGAAPHNARAAIELAAGNPRAALSARLDGLRADPHDPWCWAGIGELLLATGSANEAVDPLTRAATLASGWESIEEALVAALLIAGRGAELRDRSSGDDPTVHATRPAAIALASAAAGERPATRLEPSAAAAAGRILERVARAGHPDLAKRLGRALTLLQ